MEVWKTESLGACEVSGVAVPGATFVSDDERVFLRHVPGSSSDVSVERAGPRARLFFDVSQPDFAVGVVTCGGLCPGLNSVLRALVLSLTYGYGVKTIKGFRFGFEGLGEQSSFDLMTPDTVRQIHHFGGSLIGTSRGPQKPETMVDCLVREKVSILFVIGGDGTLRGGRAICQEISRRNLRISVVGVPKTVDNDVPLMERTFGFETAVARAVDAISAAHCEAFSQRDGIGLVKLMGRDSGFIALHATVASGEVNLCLIPECDFSPDRVVEYVEDRLARRGHCVIVVAEGAGQKCFRPPPGSEQEFDASGNVRFVDVGLELKRLIEKRIPRATLKYIDPSYMIRSAPADPHDEQFCATLAQMAVHAGMAGKTCLTVAHLPEDFAHLPLDKLQGRKHVDLNGTTYQTMLRNVGQPACLNCTKCEHK